MLRVASYIVVARTVSTLSIGIALATAPIKAPATAQAPEPSSGWHTIEQVLRSPRCMNCHPRGDVPTQGDDMHPHLMNVQRGPDGTGSPGMNCSTCHQPHNQTLANIPGAPNWHLSPRSMGWVGLSSGDLCRTLKDRSKNGDRSPADIKTHMTGDALVSWGWTPGEGRNSPAVPVKMLEEALDQWVRAGAPCPR